MKDFDSDWADRKSVDARTFRFCGEEFVMKKAVKPELLAIRDDITDETSVEDTMKALDDLFLSLIETADTDAEARYRTIRDDPEGLGIGDLNEVIDYLIEKQTGRPPTQLSDSSPGLGLTGTPSTGVSSKRVRAA